jgi:hypothetical protein
VTEIGPLEESRRRGEVPPTDRSDGNDRRRPRKGRTKFGSDLFRISRLRRNEFGGILVLGFGLAVAAAVNFVFASVMGRLLRPSAFGALGLFIVALIAVTGPMNALSGGTEMFAVMRSRFPRGRRRLSVLAVGTALWLLAMMARSPTVRSAGWLAAGAATNLLLAWNRGALSGFGRFAFVGVTFVIDVLARLGLAVLLVTVGLGLEGASAGIVLGMLIALVVTEVAVPRSAAASREPLGRDVWVALLGLFLLGMTQIIDVIAVRVWSPNQSASYVAAASLARVALFSQFPAATYVLRRAAVEGPREVLPRTLLLALAPGLVAITVIEFFPRELLRIAYGGRYLGSASILRVLGVAMLLGGFATVAAQLLMGVKSTGWVWPILSVALLGTAAIITFAHSQPSVAIFSATIQATALLAVGIPAMSRLRAAAHGRSRGHSTLARTTFKA